MKPRFLFLPLLAATAAPAWAGDPPDASIADSLTLPAVASRWEVGLGYSGIMGLKTRFNGLGNFRSPFTPQPLGSGIDRDYDNGFVHVDSSGNAGGQTWNWGYSNNSQYNPAGTGSIAYSITNSLGNAQAKDDGGANPGVNLSIAYDMGAAGFTTAGGKATWGFRGGLQYSHINVDNHDVLSTGLTTTTDTYDLGGTLPPSAPYTGSFGGPGALLGDNPTRTTVAGGTGLVTGTRELDVNLSLLNLGTYLEIPVTKKFSALLEAGVSFGLASGSYDFRSNTTLAGLGVQQSAGSASRTRFLPGAYAGVGATYQLTPSWGLQASGRYQYLTNFDLGANGSQASLSFDSAFVLSIGGVYSF